MYLRNLYTRHTCMTQKQYEWTETTQINLCVSLVQTSGLVLTKGLRLSQALGLNPVLQLRLLSQLSFVLKSYSQRVT